MTGRAAGPGGLGAAAGPSLGTAVARSILLGSGKFGFALTVIGLVALAGVVTAVLIPRGSVGQLSR